VDASRISPRTAASGFFTIAMPGRTVFSNPRRKKTSFALLARADLGRLPTPAASARQARGSSLRLLKDGEWLQKPSSLSLDITSKCC